MPFTPESMLNAEHLDRPRLGDIYDVTIDTSYVHLINRDHICEKHFQVIWPGHNHYYVDPVVELFIPLRKRYRKRYDLHIGLDPVFGESKEGLLAYRLVPGVFTRKNIDTRVIESELDHIAPLILNDLDDLFQTWAEADNGLCVYLKDQNVASIHAFLESIGLRKHNEPEDEPGSTPEETEAEKAARKAAEKAARRKAFYREHPEFDPKNKKRRHSPIR